MHVNILTLFFCVPPNPLWGSPDAGVIKREKLKEKTTSKNKIRIYCYDYVK